MLKRLLLAVFLLVVVLPLFASETQQDNIDLVPYMEVLDSNKQDITLEQARASSDWVSLEGKSHLGRKQYEQWVRVELTNKVTQGHEQLLEFSFYYLDTVTAYFYYNNAFIKQYVSGDSIPFASKPISNRKLLFPVPQPGLGKINVYFKVNTKGVTKVSLLLWNKIEFLKQDEINTIWNGIVLGALIILIFYHLFLLVKIQRLDIVALVFLLCVSLFFIVVNWGYGVQYIWPQAPELNNKAVPILGLLSSFAFLMFFYTFVSISKNKITKYYTLALILVSFILTIMCFVLPVLIMVPVMILMVNFNYLSVVIMLLIFWRLGEKNSKYFLMATAPIFLSVFLNMAGFFGVILPMKNAGDSLGIAITLFLSFLALGVAYKIRDKQDRTENKIMNLNRDLEGKVDERTRELNLSLDKLKDTQDKLIQSKKMAALTGLVVGVAHEMNTPLGVGITASSFLREQYDSLVNDFERNDITKNHLEMYLHATGDSLGLIETSLAKASKQVEDFKLINAKNSYSQKETINMLEYVDHEIEELDLKSRGKKVNVQLNCSHTLKVECVGEFISQVFEILIVNSVEHACFTSNEGDIVITIKSNENTLLIDYEDGGEGLTQEDVENIFNPFNTSKRGGGHIGLGTTIMYNAITHTFKGDVSCALSANGGLAYHIEIPVKILVN